MGDDHHQAARRRALPDGPPDGGHGRQYRSLAGDLDGAYAAGNRALDEAARSGSIGSSWFVIWFPSMRPFRQDPRFQAFVGRLDLPEYWEVYGPPDGCALEEGKIACQ